MAQWKFDHLPNSLDLAVKTSNVLVSDNRYPLLLRGRLTHHLDDGRLCDLDWSVGTGPSCNEWDCAAENTEEGHVPLDEGHVHESAFDEPDKLFVHTQSNICGREDYCL